MILDEAEPHFGGSEKMATVFFRMSRSIRSRSFSRRSREISTAGSGAECGADAVVLGRSAGPAFHPPFRPRQLRSIEGAMPSSPAICVNGRPLLASRATASCHRSCDSPRLWALKIPWLAFPPTIQPGRAPAEWLSRHRCHPPLGGGGADGPTWRTDDDPGTASTRLSVTAIARRTGRDPKTVRKYIERGVEAPVYGPRSVGRPSKLAPFMGFLRERVVAFSDLSAVRLTREIRELGYLGAYTAVKRCLAAIRPENGPKPYEVRFETPPGVQAQVDFARFVVDFTDDPGASRVVWLFSLVLGHSRFLFARYVLHQDLQTLLRCHVQAFEAIGGVPIEILYDRMKTAVTGEDDQGHIAYNRSLLALAQHYRFQPRACRPYRAKTEGKVERPFSYIRQDFFLGRSFRDLEDLNAQLIDWLGTVANVRVHGTTQRVVAEAFAAEQPELQTLPEHRFDAVLKLERRVSRDGFVAIGGNYYSVPDRTRRVVEVQQLPGELRLTHLLSATLQDRCNLILGVARQQLTNRKAAGIH